LKYTNEINENKRQINNFICEKGGVFIKRAWYNINSYQKATSSFARIVNNILKNEEVDKKDDEEK
jgi:hypothetical protein